MRGEPRRALCFLPRVPCDGRDGLNSLPEWSSLERRSRGPFRSWPPDGPGEPQCGGRRDGLAPGLVPLAWCDAMFAEHPTPRRSRRNPRPIQLPECKTASSSQRPLYDGFLAVRLPHEKRNSCRTIGSFREPLQGRSRSNPGWLFLTVLSATQTFRSNDAICDNTGTRQLIPFTIPEMAEGTLAQSLSRLNSPSLIALYRDSFPF